MNLQLKPFNPTLLRLKLLTTSSTVEDRPGNNSLKLNIFKISNRLNKQDLYARR